MHCLICFYFFRILAPMSSDTTNNKIKMKNNTLAIVAAPAAIPVKPNSAAIIATTKKMRVQRNIILCFKDYYV